MNSRQTTIRPRENGASFAARRAHNPPLSISDDNHHVTEAIGYMYEDESENDPRRTSGGPSHHSTSHHAQRRPLESQPSEEAFPPRQPSIPRKRIPQRQMSNGNAMIGPSSQTRPQPIREYSWEKGQQHGSGSRSPPFGSRERAPSDTATSQFPLNDIDYESSPAAVAQELSNLQALRRMSMDVGAAGDPDLPQLNAAALPSMPSSTASEDDSSRLFWVPARLHPELAPKEFKSFLDSKAEQIKRRSGELSSFSSPTSSRASSLSADDGGGLRRKKSMLSRQIDNSSGYQDGADRLERKRSLRRERPTDPNLQELESMVSGDGSKRSSLDSQAFEENGDVILPSVPGSSLKRSTRTNYRRGGSVKGRQERPSYALRAARRQTGGGDSPATPSTPEVPPMPNFDPGEFNLAQTLKDPSSAGPSATQRSASNFSRPALTRTPSPPTSQQPPVPKTFESILSQQEANRNSTASMPERRPEPMSYGQPSSGQPYEQRQVPQIVEVPPPEEQSHPRPMSAPSPPVQPPMRHPERSSSREAKHQPVQRPGAPGRTSPSPSSMGVPQPSRSGAVSPPSFRQQQQPQSLDQPSPLPGNDTNTNNLSFIPTLTVDKRADQKKKDEGGKKSGWGWLLGKEDKDQEKAEKPKAKILKPPQSDNTRLDVLQTSIDGSSRKESLVLDRESLKLEEERKKESQRKSSDSGGKKEKESLFSSIFGGKKAKAEKEASKKHFRDRLSPEPTSRELKPDIDYNWTRFSILEERAIYRMAHIKLANPRRALYSQVLLSNFMYSYLAKVQQMHPQMNLPTSAKQQRKQQKQEPQQPDEFTQYQRYQQVSSSTLLRGDKLKIGQQQGDQPQPAQPEPQPQAHQQYAPQQGYEGDQAMYDYNSTGQRPSSRGSKQTADSNGQGYPGGNQYYHQQQQNLNSRDDDDDDDDMW